MQVHGPACRGDDDTGDETVMITLWSRFGGTTLRPGRGAHGSLSVSKLTLSTAP
jgi:hypothetical protein